MRSRPPIKTHGGKYYLSPFIIEQFPSGYENLIYVEVFVGGGSVLLNKRPSYQEIINDKDYNVMSLWKSLRYHPELLSYELTTCPYLEETFEWAKSHLEKVKGSNDFLLIGRLEYIVRRMSRGGMRKAFGWSKRLRGGKPGDLNAWETALANIPAIAQRVSKVEMWNLDFRPVLENWGHDGVLMYLDPPYMEETRAKGSTRIYEHEMSISDHVEMLDLSLESSAKILISGYPSPLYLQKLKNWQCIYKDVPNHSSQSKVKKSKRECLWKNF